DGVKATVYIRQQNVVSTDRESLHLTEYELRRIRDLDEFHRTTSQKYRHGTTEHWNRPSSRACVQAMKFCKAGPVLAYSLALQNFTCRTKSGNTFALRCQKH